MISNTLAKKIAAKARLLISRQIDQNGRKISKSKAAAKAADGLGIGGPYLMQIARGTHTHKISEDLAYKISQQFDAATRLDYHTTDLTKPKPVRHRITINFKSAEDKELVMNHVGPQERCGILLREAKLQNTYQKTLTDLKHAI